MENQLIGDNSAIFLCSQKTGAKRLILNLHRQVYNILFLSFSYYFFFLSQVSGKPFNV